MAKSLWVTTDRAHMAIDVHLSRNCDRIILYVFCEQYQHSCRGTPSTGIRIVDKTASLLDAFSQRNITSIVMKASRLNKNKALSLCCTEVSVESKGKEWLRRRL